MPLLYDWLKTTAKTQGNSKALVYRDNYLSWRGLLHRVDRRAREFQSMGIKKHAWVGLMLGNVPDFVILALALSKLDAVIVPIDPTTGSRELELILAAAPLRALVTRPRGSEGSITASGTPAPPPQRGPRGRDPGREPGTYDEIPGEAIPESRRRLQGTLLTCSVFKRTTPELGLKPLSVMFTADSLGDPKGVLRTEENMVAVTKNVITALEIDHESRILTAVPLFHAYGWDIGLLPTLKTGATMFLEEEISARRVAKLLRDHTIDILPGTPGMYAELIRLPTAKPLVVKNPRYLSAGSQLADDVAEGFASKYDVRIVSCYHTTEVGVIAVDNAAKTPGSVGKLVDGVELKITDAAGKPVTGAKKGSVWVRGPSLSPKSIGPYHDLQEAEPAAKGAKTGAKKAAIGIGETDKAGWLRTGDTAKHDRSSRLFLTGREDDVVKVDGKRVALGEVEGCLESFPKVKEARARVVVDPMSGAMVVARVVARSKCHAEEIIDHCARNLAPYKVPRRIEFCDTLA
ncbi:MAG TPA: class I adenylate-forming enzyme family protein [Kofleriaceae bacterium]|nr:class I adenylate-forming enzyme family protein [Kofleriaceae bacterium]